MTTRINVSDERIPWVRFMALRHDESMTAYVDRLIAYDMENAPLEDREAYGAFVESVRKATSGD